MINIHAKFKVSSLSRSRDISQTQNKLYQIYPTIPSYSTLSSSSLRKDQIIYKKINRLRIGHTRLTHSYLIEHTDPPKCTN